MSSIEQHPSNGHRTGPVPVRRIPLRGADPGASTDHRTVELADVRLASQTVPRGSSRGGGEPAVDLEVWVLHVRYQRTRQPDLLARLVGQYMTYAQALAGRFHRHHEPLEDLRQVAAEALVRALQRFDCGRGVPFVAFAAPTITGAHKRHYRDHGWAVRVPAELQ